MIRDASQLMLDPQTQLIDAAIALAWSESGTAAKLRGEPDAEALFDPWPEMDGLVAALDVARPGWREQAPAAENEVTANG